MSTRLREPISQASHIVEQNEGALAPFFLEKNSKEPNIITFDQAVAEEVNARTGTTYQRLRTTFDPIIAHNNRGLERARVNAHGRDHMDRVAGAAHQLGQYLGYSDEELQAATLASSFHDVGYRFPKDIESPEINPQDFDKARQDPHPLQGADDFAHVLSAHVHRDEIVRGEMEWWGREHDEIAHRAIRHHSNGSDYDPEYTSDLAKGTRGMDKLDNTYQRVFPSHINAIQAIAMGKSVEGVRERVRLGADVALSADEFINLDDSLGAAQEFDPAFQHRIVPHGILEQYLRVDPATLELEMHYAVDIKRVQQILGPDYSAEQFLAHFDEAYGGKSMPRAAEVAHSIRSRRGFQVDPSEDALDVHFHFADGTKAVKGYAPKFD